MTGLFTLHCRECWKECTPLENLFGISDTETAFVVETALVVVVAVGLDTATFLVHIHQNLIK